MEPTHYRLLADLVVVAHLLFVAFVVVGGLLVGRWPRLAWAHLPSAAWGALLSFAGWVCPLTPLEDAFRRLGGEDDSRPRPQRANGLAGKVGSSRIRASASRR